MATKSDPSTYIFNHTMFRIRDPKKSIEFYEKVLGMEVGSTARGRELRWLQLHICGCELALATSPCSPSLTPSPLTPVLPPVRRPRLHQLLVSDSHLQHADPSLGYPSGFGAKAEASKEDKGSLFTTREGVLELCHNHGTGASILAIFHPGGRYCPVDLGYLLACSSRQSPTLTSRATCRATRSRAAASGTSALPSTTCRPRATASTSLESSSRSVPRTAVCA